MSQKLPFEDKFEIYNQAGGPGMVAMAMKDGEVLFKKAYGLADIQSKEKMTSHTRFRLGHSSSAFTGMAIAILEEQNKIHPDDLLKDYFDDLPNCMDDVKISHLYQNTSGLPYVLEGFCSKAHADRPVSSAQLYSLYKSQDSLKHTPGNMLSYETSGKIILCLLIEKITGKHIYDYLDETLFRPLGMKDIVLDMATPMPDTLTTTYGFWPYFEDPDIACQSPACNHLFESRGLFLSLEESILWFKAVDSGHFVSPEKTNQMLTHGFTNHGDKVNCNYFRYIDDFYGHKLVFPDGNSTDRSELGQFYFPDQNLWIAVFTNAFAIPPWCIMSDMAKHYLKLETM